MPGMLCSSGGIGLSKGGQGPIAGIGLRQPKTGGTSQSQPLVLLTNLSTGSVRMTQSTAA
jgi:hypothetical protein